MKIMSKVFRIFRNRELFPGCDFVLQDPEGLKLSIHELMKRLEGTEFDVVAGAEARGFLFGMPLAYNKSKGFVPIRRKESFRGRPSVKNMTWSTVRKPSRCTRMPSSRARE